MELNGYSRCVPSNKIILRFGDEIHLPIGDDKYYVAALCWTSRDFHQQHEVTSCRTIEAFGPNNRAARGNGPGHCESLRVIELEVAKEICHKKGSQIQNHRQLKLNLFAGFFVVMYFQWFVWVSRYQLYNVIEIWIHLPFFALQVSGLSGNRPGPQWSKKSRWCRVRVQQKTVFVHCIWFFVLHLVAQFLVEVDMSFMMMLRCGQLTAINMTAGVVSFDRLGFRLSLLCWRLCNSRSRSRLGRVWGIQGLQFREWRGATKDTPVVRKFCW